MPAHEGVLLAVFGDGDAFVPVQPDDFALVVAAEFGQFKRGRIVNRLCPRCICHFVAFPVAFAVNAAGSRRVRKHLDISFNRLSIPCISARRPIAVNARSIVKHHVGNIYLEYAVGTGKLVDFILIMRRSIHDDCTIFVNDVVGIVGRVSDFILFLRVVAVALDAPAIDVCAIGLLVARKCPCVAVFRLAHCVIEVKFYRIIRWNLCDDVCCRIRVSESADVHAVFPNNLILPPVVSARRTHRANHRLVADVAVDHFIIVQLHRRIPVRLAVHDCLGHMQQVNLQFRPCKNRSIEVAAVRRGCAQFDVLLRFVGIPLARDRQVAVYIHVEARLNSGCTRALAVRNCINRDDRRTVFDRRQKSRVAVNLDDGRVAAFPVETSIARIKCHFPLLTINALIRVRIKRLSRWYFRRHC